LSGAKTDLVNEFNRDSISAKTLRRSFYRFLDNPSLPQPPGEPKDIYLKVDAKYFGRWGCLLLYKAGRDLIYWNFVRRETFGNYLYDLTQIRRLGYTIVGVTSDWHGSIVSAVEYLFRGAIPHQRCLVHTQRRCESLLTKNPKTRAGTHLLQLVRDINQVTNHYEAKLWTNRLFYWERDYGYLTKERTYGWKEDRRRTWWYTHKNLRSAFRTLNNTTNHLFLYLDYKYLEKDTNGLESEFSHLKQKLNMHRGLKRYRKVKAIYWFCHFKSLERRNEKT